MKEPNRTLAPKHGEPSRLVLDEPEVVVFDNGIKAYLIKTGEEKITRLDIVIKAGFAFQENKLVANSTAKLLKEGTKNFSSEQIARKFDKCGAHFETSVSKDSANLTLYSLTKHLEELLPIMGEMLTNAKFDEEELNIHIDRKRQEFLVNSEKVRYRAMLEFNQMVFGKNTAYGQILELDDFDKLNKKNLSDFYGSQYKPNNAYIILSGMVDDGLIKLANKYLGNEWHKVGINHRNIIFTENHIEKEKFIPKQGAMQSAIRIGRPIIGKIHPDYNKFILLNTVLGGYFGSRLMSNLREDKGYTYGINASVANYLHGAYFSISTEVNAESTRASLQEINGELNLLKEKRIGKDELQLVKNYIYGAFLRNFDGPFALADRFQSVNDFNLGFDFYRNSLDEIMSINASELQDTANQYLDEKEMITLVVGNTN